MDRTPSNIPANTTDDVSTFRVSVEAEGVRREVSITVSPRPLDAVGWASVVKAVSDLVTAYPERFQ